MISQKEVLKIHSILIEKYGGLQGVRDIEILDSALNRPYQTFDSRELYPSPIDKASAIIESIVKNHPFVDGNKRMGYVLMRLILLESDLDIESTEDDKYEFVIEIASGRLDFDGIKDWLVQRINVE